MKVLNLSDHLLTVESSFEIFNEVIEVEVGKLIELPQLIQRLVDIERKHKVKFDTIVLPAYTPLISHILYYFCVVYDFDFSIYVPVKAGTDFYLINIPEFRANITPA
jgi:hypothetical protein